jgi:hypothetical protein
MALTILAGVVLLPPHARLQTLEHQRDCRAVRLQEARDTCAAMDRLLTVGVLDPVLTERQARGVLGWFPTGEVVVIDPNIRPEIASGVLSPVRYPDPPAPAGWDMDLARKVQAPARRRGLFVLASAMMLAAVLIFAPPSFRLRPKRPLAPPAVTRDAKRSEFA